MEGHVLQLRGSEQAVGDHGDGLLISIKLGNFLTGCGSAGFSKRTLLDGDTDIATKCTEPENSSPCSQKPVVSLS
jgi:hypothetical protein